MISVQYHNQSPSLTEALNEIQNQTLNRFRKRFVTQVLDETLQRVIDRHPVETGRARNAWQIARQQLNEGGVSVDSADGDARFHEERQLSIAEATNRVNYVVFLEEGTHQMSPRHLVARSLAEVFLRLDLIAAPIVREEILSQ